MDADTERTVPWMMEAEPGVVHWTSQGMPTVAGGPPEPRERHGAGSPLERQGPTDALISDLRPPEP